jgi:hypothetical protein
MSDTSHRALETFLDLYGLSELTDEEWAEGCVALSLEVFPADENWGEESRT